MEVGGWVHVSHGIFCVENPPKIAQNKVLIFWISIPYSVCILLKVVSYYDLSVLSMSVMSFQKKFGMLLV